MVPEDRTPFEAIFNQFGLTEKDVIVVMRNNLKSSSFRLWRQRVTGRKSKHLKLRNKILEDLNVVNKEIFQKKRK